MDIMNRVFEHGGTIFAVARELGISPGELLDFSASINPLGPPPGVWPAIEEAFSWVGHYPDTACTGLRLLLAEKLGVAPEQLVVGNGSTELIHLIPRQGRFSRKRALLVAPTFSEYGHGLELAGWSFDYLFLSPGDGFALELSRVEERLGGGYDLLYLCNPGNPTGRLYSRDEVGALLGLCREAGTFCVLDEAFMDFCEDGAALPLLARNDGFLILRSMTKFYGFPGIRLGYALGSGKIIAELERLRPPWSVGTLAQAAGMAALADRGHGENTVALVTAERGRLAEGLAGMPGVKVYPGAANYLLGELTCGGTAGELARRLLGRRILIRDCSNFPGLNGRFFRVAVRGAVENGLLLEGIAATLPLLS